MWDEKELNTMENISSSEQETEVKTVSAILVTMLTWENTVQWTQFLPNYIFSTTLGK